MELSALALYHWESCAPVFAPVQDGLRRVRREDLQAADRLIGQCRKGLPVNLESLQAQNMKIRIFPHGLIFILALLGVLSLLDEAWRGPVPDSLVSFLLAHHLWDLWNTLRWQYMYSHEVLHFLSGVVGSMVGCWIYFAIQKRKA
jgi:hypothetical protein